MLNAMNTGHEGSLTTLHAGSAEEALMRLVLMARFGMDLPTDLIEEQISTAIDLIVVTRRLTDGTRVVTSLTEVSRAEDGSARLEECVSYRSGERSWELRLEPAFVRRGIEDGVLSEEEVGQWRQR